jgi:hypothetical protein
MICGKDTHAPLQTAVGCGYDFCIRCLLPWDGHGERYVLGDGCQGALVYHKNRGNPWAIKLMEHCRSLHPQAITHPQTTTTNTISDDEAARIMPADEGREYWKKLYKQYGIDKAKEFVYSNRLPRQ